MRVVLFLLVILKPLWSLAQQPKMMLPIGHTATVNSLAFSSDSKTIASASNDQTVKVWDVNTGSLLINLIGHSAEVNYVTFSHDNKKIGSCDRDGNVILWDAIHGQKLISFNASTANVSGISFSPDDKRVVSASYDHTAKVWNATTGEMMLNLQGHKSHVRCVAYSNNGRAIVTEGDDSTSIVWNAETGKSIFEWHGRKIFYPKAPVFSKDDKLVITNGRLFSLQTGEELRKICSYGASFSPEGKRIIYPCGLSIIIEDRENGKRLNQYEQSNWVEFANFTSDGTKIIAVISSRGATSEHFIHIIDARTGQTLSKMPQNRSYGTMVLSHDGRHFATTNSWYLEIDIWNTNSGSRSAILRGYVQRMNGFVFSPDGKKLLVASGDRTAKVFDFQNAELSTVLSGHEDAVTSAAFSTRGDEIVTASDDYAARIWSSNGMLIHHLAYHRRTVTTAQFNFEGNKVVTASVDHTAIIWDAYTGQLLNALPHAHTVQAASFSPNGKMVITASWDYTAKIWDVETGRLLHTLSHEFYVDDAVFSPDNTKVVTSSWNCVRIWDVNTGKRIPLVDECRGIASSACFTDDSRYVLAALNDGSARVWRLETGELLRNFQIGRPRAERATLTKDERAVLVSYSHDTSRLWDTEKETVRFILRGNRAVFSPNEKSILTADKSYQLFLWDAETGKLKFTLFFPGVEKYFIMSVDGYYKSSPAAAKLLHYVTPDLKVITFEQLDVKYNRPDKVLEAIGCPDTALIQSYRKAYHKRIKKLGIDTLSFREDYSVSEADFTDRDAIGYEQKAGTLNLRIHGGDSTYPLDRFNVWVNESPVFGVRGVSLRKRGTGDLDTSITIALSSGKNTVETSVTNSNGIESYRKPLFLNYTPATARTERVHFIGIGIDSFQDARRNLRWSAADIRALAKAFKQKHGDRCTVDTLLNRAVTREAVAALKEKLLRTGVDDKVIIAYSGHGLLSDSFDYYLSTYGMDFMHPEAAGLSYDALEGLLDGIPARKKLLLLDACHSGEVDKEELKRYADAAGALASAGVTRGAEMVGYDTTGAHLGMKNSFELMQSLFVNVGRSTGATVISAAAGTQFAYEKGELGNGVFTYSILEKLRADESVTVSSLRDYVGKRVSELTAGLQVPTVRSEAKTVDWFVW